MKSFLYFLAFVILSSNIRAQKVPERIPAHDPVMIKEGSTYYMLCTGLGVTVYSSKDMVNWTHQSPVFDKAPEWAVKAVPGFK